ncbi:peptidase M23-like protein [Arcicella aurantiaca]|uniref:Peptidase M23-like protein n=1 Tax=Arcicella aurantiaca TaxID=591202 RepID=A0A316E8V1_9BACT|nr:M23 family metallopeptidase [Arcicella aurantiaca]PWK26496.1 peptidase M23-like protein [Arcicella aurantiaca]
MKKITIIIFLSLIYLNIQAQKPQLTYPKGYFLFPINPNQQNYLAGGMGDLRSDHFHSGIDIKTQGREGLPVYATGDGYISEVRVQTSGYGNVIFITHPNGFVSVYGHLKTFAEPLASYIRKKRLESQTFEIKLSLKPEEFEVARGQIIGLSGNTGGSAGPHLHFEIRDGINNILNPLNFGFAEIKDNLPPIFQQLIIKTLSTNSRINGEFGKQLFYPTKTGNNYSLNNEIFANGELGLELLAVDKMNGTNNSNGLSCVELFVDGEEQYYSHLEQFPNDVSHDINVHNDYAQEQMKGQRFQKLFQEDGNNSLQIYKPSLTKGKIKITDGKTHQITVKIWDTFENSSVLNFTINGEKKEVSTTISPNTLPVSLTQTLEDNTLIIKARNLKTINSVASFKFAKSTIDLPINYVKNNEAVYLWDLKKGLPDSIKVDGVSKATNFRKVIVPNIDDAFESDALEINFEYKSLYNTLYLQTEQAGNKLKISEVTIPLKSKLDVIYTPENQAILPDKTSVYHIFRNAKSFLKTSWSGNKASFSIKRLGDFVVLTDTIPPKASMMKKTPDDIRIRIGDNLSGIKNFKAFVNNEYILTDYDAKNALLWAVKSDSTQKFYGKLRLELEDNQGNKSAFEANIDTVKVKAKPVIKKVVKTKKNELKNRRQSPKLRTERPKRKHR